MRATYVWETEENEGHQLPLHVAIITDNTLTIRWLFLSELSLSLSLWNASNGPP